MHFYKKEGKWNYLSQKDYESKKDTLPEITFAIKCPIEDLESKNFPDLEKLAAENIAIKDDEIQPVQSTLND